MDLEVAYAVGLWKADRCSTAKGVVGLRNKQDALLDAFEKFLKKRGLKVKWRTIMGFSKTKEVYTCNSSLRREFESVFLNRNNLGHNGKLSYFAGRIDGDGTVDAKYSHVRIYYSHKEGLEALEDSEILRSMGQDAIVRYYNEIL